MSDVRGAAVAAAHHVRKAKRSTGRVLISAVGFSVAYFLDTENGAARRQRFQEFIRRTVGDLDEVLTPELGSIRPIRSASVTDSRTESYPSSRGVRLVAPW